MFIAMIGDCAKRDNPAMNDLKTKTITLPDGRVHDVAGGLGNGSSLCGCYGENPSDQEGCKVEKQSLTIGLASYVACSTIYPQSITIQQHFDS
ncbi:MAG: hypothetical protein WBO17_01860 [Sphingorhabdus sp.]